MNKIKSLCIAALTITLLGCSPKPATSVSELQIKIHELETSLAEVVAKGLDDRKKLESEIYSITESNRMHEGQVAVLEAKIASLESINSDQAEQILALTQTVERARAYVEQLRGGANTATIRGSSPPRNINPAYEDFIHPPVGANPDLYPINVFNVFGKRFVSGTRTEYVPKSSSVRTTTRDQYGRIINSTGHGTTWKETTVKEYDYNISFSFRNLTKTPKTVRFDAGAGTRDVSIPAGAVLDNQVIPAREGSALNATVSGQTKSFNVAR
jgi:hypothetical protein